MNLAFQKAAVEAKAAAEAKAKAEAEAKAGADAKAEAEKVVAENLKSAADKAFADAQVVILENVTLYLCAITVCVQRYTGKCKLTGESIISDFETDF